MVQVLFRFMNGYLKELGGCKKGYFSRWLNANIVEKCLRKWFQNKQEIKNDGGGEHRGEGGDCLGGISPPAVTQSWRPGIWRVFVLRERAGRKEDGEDAEAALGPACMLAKRYPGWTLITFLSRRAGSADFPQDAWGFRGHSCVQTLEQSTKGPS